MSGAVIVSRIRVPVVVVLFPEQQYPSSRSSRSHRMSYTAFHLLTAANAPALYLVTAVNSLQYNHEDNLGPYQRGLLGIDRILDSAHETAAPPLHLEACANSSYYSISSSCMHECVYAWPSVSA